MKNIHVLTTDKPSRLFEDDFGKLFFSINIDQEQKHFKPQNIYITSDEEIKEGDWMYYKHFGEDITCKYDTMGGQNTNVNEHKDFYKKIILTTDQYLIKDGVQSIDDEFLEWFVKNSSCEEVEVKLNSFGECHMEGDYCSCYDTADQSLCTLYYPNYKIIIPKEEPKQESMKTKLIILEHGNILVSDEEIKDGDFYYRIESPSAIITKASKVESELLNKKTTIKDALKLIASDNPEHNLPNINYNGLEENFGIVHWSRHWEIVNQQLYGQGGVNPHAYRLGFKQSQSLNDKKFTLEDMRKAFEQGYGFADEKLIIHRHDEECKYTFDNLIQSLQQPKVFDIEVEMEKYYSDEFGNSESANELIEKIKILTNQI